MFSRDHHVRIGAILGSLDAELLASHRCYFGGGTAIVLRFGEYRESVDIDFLVSDREGYRALRQLAKSGQLQALTIESVAEQLREMRVDQYGIRTLLRVGEAEIKFEIIQEARVELDEPLDADRICGVSTLTPLDMVASKLLANSDRWADTSARSRDIIDLAMMRPPEHLLRAAVEKANAAYGTVEDDLRRAFERLRGQPQQLDQHMQAMKMATVPKAVLWANIRELVSRLD